LALRDLRPMDNAPETDWQAWAAIGVVALTVLILVARGIFRIRGKPRSCGKCGTRDCD